MKRRNRLVMGGAVGGILAPVMLILVILGFDVQIHRSGSGAVPLSNLGEDLCILALASVIGCAAAVCATALLVRS
jgi:Na+/proline symporter